MKLTRRRILVGSAAVVAVIGGAWFTFSERSQPPFGVTRSAFRAIRMGMTVEEVERVIGQSSHMWHMWFRYNHSHVALEAERGFDESSYAEGPGFASLQWYDDDTVIQVVFNSSGLVCETSLYSPPLRTRFLRQIESFWGKLGF